MPGSKQIRGQADGIIEGRWARPQRSRCAERLGHIIKKIKTGRSSFRGTSWRSCCATFALHKNLQVTLYSFTHLSVTRALVEQHKEGIAVTVLLDRHVLLHPYSRPRILELLGRASSSLAEVVKMQVIVVDEMLV